MLPPAFINLLGRGSAFVVTGVLIWVFDWSLHTASVAFATGGLLMFVLALRSAEALARARFRTAAAPSDEQNHRLL